MMEQFLAELKRLLAEPISCVREREQTKFDRMLETCGGRVVLFGAGNLGQKALSCLRKIGVDPLAFSDNDPSKWGTRVHDLPVLSPSDAAGAYGQSALFVVTIWSEGHRYAGTHAQLSALNCTRVTAAAPLRWKFYRELLPDYCHDLPHKVYEQADEVFQAGKLWADEQSRSEYLRQIRWRALGDYDALSVPVTDESYFPNGIFNWLPGEMFVDCGAFDGDTARRIIERQHAQFGCIFAIEPDHKNFSRMQHWLESLAPGIASKVQSFNLAVGARSGEVRFSADGTAASAINDAGATTIACVSLDELLRDARPTYIKMDIEGAEVDALRGAESTIRVHRPVLGVCVYHRQSDLWRIPSLIAGMCPDYHFFLRPHGDEGRETVCYAVPPHRMFTSVLGDVA